MTKMYAIDACHSRDLDDAVAVSRAEAGWRVTVAVALVAPAVEKDSDLDGQARALAFTRYNARGAVKTMLPRRLTENDLSLSPAAPRQVLKMTVDLDENLEPGAPALAVEVMDPIIRVPFDVAKAAADDPDHDLHGDIGPMWQLASSLLERRRRRGALAFYDVKSGVVTDEEGQIVVLENEDAHKGYIIVQEMMILANAVLAAWCVGNGLPILFRNHRANPAASRETLLDDLASADQDYGAYAKSRLTLMLQKARQGATCDGHFGLNLPGYAWFTSPLRRYADLVNQRILLAHVTGSPLPYDTAELTAVAEHLNATNDALSEEKSAYFHGQTRERAQRQMQSPILSRLSDADFERVVAEAYKTGTVTPEFADEAVKRIAAGRIQPKEMSRLLFLPGDGDESASVRRAVGEWLLETPYVSIQILHYLAQTEAITDLEIDAEAAGMQFAGRASARMQDKAYESPNAVHTTKKGAGQLAGAGLLAAMAEIDLALPEQPPMQHPSPKAEPEITVPEEVSPERAKNALQELCQKHRWPMPEFDSEQSGPPHQPTFRARCKVSVGDRVIRTAPVTGTSKKDSEKKAAAMALSLIKESLAAT